MEFFMSLIFNETNLKCIPIIHCIITNIILDKNNLLNFKKIII